MQLRRLTFFSDCVARWLQPMNRGGTQSETCDVQIVAGELKMGGLPTAQRDFRPSDDRQSDREHSKRAWLQHQQTEMKKKH
jgi:hypothetical protein